MTEDPYLAPKADLAAGGAGSAFRSGCGFLLWMLFAIFAAGAVCLYGLNTGSKFFLLGFGIIQLAYILPLCWWSHRTGRPMMLAGLVCGASLALLISIPCLMDASSL